MGITIIVGDFNTPFTSMDRSFRQKINKATEILKDIIEKLDLCDIFRTLHPKKYQNIHSSHVYSGLITYWGTKLTSSNLTV